MALMVACQTVAPGVLIRRPFKSAGTETGLLVQNGGHPGTS
jgi:hypothetical protein